MRLPARQRPGRGARLAGVRRYARATDGSAAVEIAIWVAIMVLPLLNVVDTGFYIYQRMQVENAAAAAAQAAWALCTTAPATKGTNCSNLTTTAQAAAQGTSLGTAVTLQTASSYENYFCANTSGALVAVGNAYTLNSSTGAGPTLPNTFSSTSSPCSSAGTGYAGNTAAPSDYVVVTVTATYNSLFPGASITSYFNSTITGVARTRLQ